MQPNNTVQYRPRRNNQIRASQVRLIDHTGINVGIVQFHEALRLAKEQGLDLVEVNAKASPIVVKIADYGKMLYEEKKRQAETRKKQTVQELKEIQFRPATDDADLQHKLEQTKGFLGENNKVKISVRFRGRELQHPEIGRNKIEWMVSQLAGLIQPIPPISFEGKLMTVVLAPLSRKG